MAQTPNDLSEAEALRREILSLREKAECIATELGARARRAFDIKARLREHRAPLIGLGGGIAALAMVFVVVKIERGRRARRLSVRMGQKVSALRQMVAHPEHVVRRRPGWQPDYGKVLTALLVTGISVALRVVSKRVLQPRRLTA
jgi:hypothetical protein